MEHVKTVASPPGRTLTDLPTEICQKIIALVLPYTSHIPARFEKYPSASTGVRQGQQRRKLDLIAYHERQDHARRSLSIMRTNKRFYADAIYHQARQLSSRTYTLSIQPGDSALNSSGSIFFLGHDYLTPRRQNRVHGPLISKREHRRNLAIAHKQAGAIHHTNFLLTHVADLVIQVNAPSSPFFSGALHIREHLTTICKLLQASKVLRTLKVEILQLTDLNNINALPSFLNGWQRRTFSCVRRVHSHDVSYDMYLALQPLILLRGLDVASVVFNRFGYRPDIHEEAMEQHYAASLMSKETVLSVHETRLRLGTRDMQECYLYLRLGEVEVLLKQTDGWARITAEWVGICRETLSEPTWKLSLLEDLNETTAKGQKRLSERAQRLRWMVSRLEDRFEQKAHDWRLYKLASLKDSIEAGETEDERVRAFAKARGIVVEGEDSVGEEDEDDEGEENALSEIDRYLNDGIAL